VIVGVLFLMLVVLSGGASLADDDEPIAFIGHGGFFDKSGKQIEVTQNFIERAQNYYQQRLLNAVAGDKAAVVADLEKLQQIPTSTHQDRLLLQNNALRSIASKSTDPEAGRIRAKLGALANAMKMQVPERAQEDAPLLRLPARKFVPDVAVRDEIAKQSFVASSTKPLFSSTTSVGQKYIEECKANGVPIPPPMGKLDPNGKDG
jgi:hypothetical protein